ncbi:EAL domain-containing protein [Halalkalibacter urbisdiaboli]|uniref:EAL domain-containing protein n=1 Tax=Halalkalibacter urbisdiaboli TaxID=1960589 RepID=UPI000B444AE3|nr:EAL domain-containing protein [Halalkalibacter urbisdiaboli]
MKIQSIINETKKDANDRSDLLNHEEGLHLDSLFHLHPHNIYSLDLRGYITDCNDSCIRLSGYSKNELLKPMHMSELLFTYEEDYIQQFFEKSNIGTLHSFRASLKKKDRSCLDVSVTFIPKIIAGEVVGAFCISEDISTLVEAENVIEQMTYYDDLTGLPNQMMLTKVLSNELNVTNNGVATLFIDLDRFKGINDTLGHENGDLLLKKVTSRLKSTVKADDIVARQSGDEFIIILKNMDRDIVSKVARKIINVLSKPIRIRNYDVFTTPSIGISLYPEDAKTADALIKNAEFAMYEAKKRRQDITFYSSNEHDLKLSPFKMEMELYKAIERKEFSLQYLPKVDLKSGKILSIEALIRWEHPRLGKVSPRVFIPVAEETGLIHSIGEWALNEACRQNKAWQEKGFYFTVSVNLSGLQFTQKDLVDVIVRSLERTGLEPQYLELEITERVTTDNNQTIEVLQKLKGLGIQICIDDFGRGSSSLNDLKQLPVDTLKIDQSFVQGLYKNPDDEMIVKSIISMAHHFNLRVVAEGIETKEQLAFLQQHHCDEGQGFFLSKPVLANQLEHNLIDIEKKVVQYGISQDVSEKMWVEKLLQKAREELNETIRLQQGMIYKFKKINQRFVHTLCDGELMYRMGFIPNQIVGKELHDFLPKSEADRIQLSYYRAWNGEDNVMFEGEVNGVCYLAALSPIKRGGEVHEVIVSCVDITDRKNTEKALRESETKYRLIAENMTDIIILFDTNGESIYVSPSFHTVLGFSLQSKEEKLIDHIHPDDVEYVTTQFSHIINAKSSSQIEFRFINSMGEEVLIECVGTAVLGEQENVEHVMIIGRDVTEKRKSEERLWRSEKLSLVGELAAGVAHEIRNPITSIKGFIQLIQQGQIKDEYFDIILPEFNRVEGIIKEFLSLAKPQEIQLKEVSISRLLREVETLLESEAHLRNVQFSSTIEPNLPRIMCDKNQMKQVVINIVKNSIEAMTDGGLITFDVKAENEHLLIKVIDNGVGISQERLQRLGEPFYSNKEKGTGLGLMLCYRIVRKHNGTLTIKSKEKIGTTVEIRLPLCNG